MSLHVLLGGLINCFQKKPDEAKTQREPAPILYVSCEELTAVKKEESTLEGTSVTLSYKYKNAATGSDYFFWYRQFPGKPPEFLISHFGTGTPISPPIPGFSFKVSDNQRQMDLQISSAAVTDSAVYYCAVRPTVTGNNKMMVESMDNEKEHREMKH
uniref:Ig-like domain-containing protein n=1 Tax=Oryzias latipes TaxID=8090 RepID=A0A3P9HX57_ORYLA